MSVEKTKDGYIIKQEMDSEENIIFPIIAMFFPRLHRLLLMIFGRFTMRATSKPRTRITEIKRTDDGWQILEYES